MATAKSRTLDAFRAELLSAGVDDIRERLRRGRIRSAARRAIAEEVIAAREADDTVVTKFPIAAKPPGGATSEPPLARHIGRVIGIALAIGAIAAAGVFLLRR